jgi:hypothetical protein
MAADPRHKINYDEAFMKREGDFLGWVLAGVATGLTLKALLQTHEQATVLIAWAVLIIVIIERRPTKVVTAKTLRIVDSERAVRGLIGHVGDGIQIGVRAEPLNNMAISPGLLWNGVPSVSFNFRYQQSYAGGRLIANRASLHATGNEEGIYKTYAAVFDSVPEWADIKAEVNK